VHVKRTKKFHFKAKIDDIYTLNCIKAAQKCAKMCNYQYMYMYIMIKMIEHLVKNRHNCTTLGDVCIYAFMQELLVAKDA